MTLLRIYFELVVAGEIIGRAALASVAYNAPSQGFVEHPSFSIPFRSSNVIWTPAVPNHLVKLHVYNSKNHKICSLNGESVRPYSAENLSFLTYTRTDYHNTFRNIEFDRLASF